MNWDESSEIGEKEFREMAPQIVARETMRQAIQTPPVALIEREIDDDWIEMPQTIENGDILYWHRKPKGKPVCYKRESNLEGA